MNKIILPYCKNHENTESLYSCESCQGYFCQECIKQKDFGPGYVAYICKECGGRCVDIRPVIDPEAQTFERPENLWRQIPQILLYPFRGNGPYLLAGGTLFFLILYFVAAFSIFGILISVGSYFIFIACCINIIRSSIITRGDDPPDWPDFTRLGDWFLPGMIIIGAGMLYYAPAWIYFNATKECDFFYWGCFAVSSYFFPMVFLNICLNENLWAINPLTNLIAVIRTFVPYTSLVCILLFFIFMKHWADAFFMMIPFVGVILNMAFYLYFLFITMRALGLFYRRFRYVLPLGKN